LHCRVLKIDYLRPDFFQQKRLTYYNRNFQNKVLKKRRKMKNKVFMGLAAIAMVAVLSSCGKKPQAEIDAANAAIEAAKTAEAPVYVPAEFAAVQDSLNAVMTAITAKESKLFKNFKAETEKLTQVVTLANTVATNAGTKKEEVKAETTTLLTDIKTVTEENGKLIPKLPRGKEGAAVIEQIKADVATVDAAVVEAQGLFDKGSYMDALNKIKAAKEKADGLNAEVKEVLTKARIKF
jgi:predicted small lipoprotein YifL